MRIQSFYQFLLIITVIFLPENGNAQIRCSPSMAEKFYKLVPKPKGDQEASIKAWKEKRKNSQRSLIDVTIPVHVIIVHPPGETIGTGDNLSLERIQSQIDVLNQDFPGINPDIVNVPNLFDVGMSEIEFCLASKDPEGNPTNGVTRYATDLVFEDNNFFIMEETIWDNSLYLNIYVTSTIQDLGFSPVPSTSYTIPPLWDAPTVLTAAFGGPGYATQPFYDLGRTAVHEVGHWLGLSHVWGPTNGGCMEDDGMDDTPTQDQPNFACPTHPLPDCGNPAVFFMNFMDYVNDECMLAFSADQVDYMHFIIEEVRPDLIGAHLTQCEDIVVPDPIVGTLLSSSDETCAGANNGTAEVTAAGGTPPYNFALDGGTLQSSGVFTNLGGGPHIIVITDSVGESSSINFNIGTSSPIFIEVVAVTNPCSGLPNGSFGVVATGGNAGPLSIQVNQNISDPTNFFQNLIAGEYIITATDSQNCTEEISYELTEAPNNILIEVIEVEEPCEMLANGAFEIQTTPESATVTVNQFLTDTNNVFSNLSAGNYVIVAEDDQGCFSQINFDLESNLNPFADIEVNIVYPLASDCQINPNSVTVEFISDSSDNINQIELNNGMISTIGMFSGLSHGEFEYIASNPDGCQEIGSFTIVGDYYYDLNNTQTIPSCSNSNDGAIIFTNSTSLPIHVELSAGEPNGPSSYVNIPAGLHNLVVMGMNNCILLSETIDFTVEGIIEGGISIDPDCETGLTSMDFDAEGGAGMLTYSLDDEVNNDGIFENLSPGIIEIMVEDENNCTEVFIVEIPPVDEALSIDLIIENKMLCFGETTNIEIDIAGGNGNQLILYNGQEFGSNVIDNIGGGIHIIEVLSNNNCSEDFYEEVEIIEYEELVVEDISISNSECSSEGGFFEANIFDGSQPYYYILDQADTILVEDLPRLEDGEHSIQIVDSNGCTSEIYEFEITVTEAINAEITIVNQVSCFGLSDGKVDLEVESNIGVSSYDWNVQNIDLQNLAAGEYSLTVTNPHDCTDVVDFEIIQPEELSIASETLIPAGNLAGSAEFNISGGTAPYLFNVNGIENQSGLFSLLQGDYTLEVRDANGCILAHDFTILLESANENIDNELDLSIYPIPAQDFLNITCLDCSNSASFFVYNIEGIKMTSGLITKFKTIDLRDFPTGYYVLVVESEVGIVLKRFIVI